MIGPELDLSFVSSSASFVLVLFYFRKSFLNVESLVFSLFVFVLFPTL